MDSLWADAGQALPVVWDGAPSHRSKTVEAYMAKQNPERPKTWLENTPPYSPELNPVGQAWAWLKKKLANRFFETTRELKTAVVKVLDEMRGSKGLIKGFFKQKALACYRFST